MIELKRELISNLFGRPIFVFFTKLELVKVQILSRKFYLEISPRWVVELEVGKKFKVRSQDRVSV
jgi:hypothetical protein